MRQGLRRGQISRPRVVFVVPVDELGGAERVICTLVVELVWLGCDIEVVVNSARRSRVFEMLHPSVQVTYTGGSGKIGAEWRLIRCVRNKSSGLVFSSHFRINVFLSVLRLVRILDTNHLACRESTFLFRRYRGIRAGVYRLLYRLLRAPDTIIAQSDEMKRELLPVLPKSARSRVIVLPNPVAVNRLAAKPYQGTEGKAGRLQVCWCGRFVAVKRPLLAIRVLKCLRVDYGIDATLTMIGSGPLLDEVKRAAAVESLLEFVAFAGHVPEPGDLMSQSDVGLLTSSVEGFPNVVLEMLSHGVPRVVSTNSCEELSQVPGVDVAEAIPEELARVICSPERRPDVHAQDIAKYLSHREPRMIAQQLLITAGLNEL